MPDLYGPDPEPYEGEYWDGHDDPPACDACGTPHGEWDRYCDNCGALVGMYARLKAEGQLEAYLAQTVDPATSPF